MLVQVISGCGWLRYVCATTSLLKTYWRAVFTALQLSGLVVAGVLLCISLCSWSVLRLYMRLHASLHLHGSSFKVAFHLCLTPERFLIEGN